MITATQARQRAIDQQQKLELLENEQLSIVSSAVTQAVDKGHLMCQVELLLRLRVKSKLESLGYSVRTTNINEHVATMISW